MCEGGFVGRVRYPTRSGQHEAEAGAVSRAIDHAGVRAALGKLPVGRGQGVGLLAIEFVFPADDFGGGEKLAQGREDFWSGPKRDHKRLAAAREFVLKLSAFDFLNLEITHRGGVENGIRLARKFAKCQREGFVCGEVPHLDAMRRGRNAPLPSKANHLKSSHRQLPCEKRPDFSRGEIGDPPDGIDRGNGRTAGDDYIFFYQLNSSYRSSFS